MGKSLLLLDLAEDFFLLPLDLLHLFIVALAHEPLKVVSFLRCAVQDIELVGVERSLGPDQLPSIGGWLSKDTLLVDDHRWDGF